MREYFATTLLTALPFCYFMLLYPCVCPLRVVQVQQLRLELPGVAQRQSETQRTHQDHEDKTKI